MKSNSVSPFSLLQRLGPAAIGMLVLGLGTGWLVLMPGAFPFDHPQFWANRVVPLACIALGMVTIGAAATGKALIMRELSGSALCSFAAFAAAMAWLYPHSRLAVWIGLLFLVALVGLLALPAKRLRCAPWRYRVVWLVAAAGLGGVVPLLQRGPEASTHPAESGPALADAKAEILSSLATYEPTASISFHPRRRRLRVDARGATLWIDPLLHFTSRSRDRGWTIWSRGDQFADDTVLVGQSESDRAFKAAYGGAWPATIRLETAADGSEIYLDARTYLAEPVYSHLNEWCALTVYSEGQKVEIQFSPLPTSIEAMPFEYPTGAPMRFGYLGADWVFRVVEASSAEKGPFRELAAGSQRRDEPLVLTLLVDGRPTFRVVLQDFATQASFDLSPTAGWNVPQNSIEFAKMPGGGATITISLAGTSVGRGWNSVGHASGTYVNRMTVTRLAARMSE